MPTNNENTGNEAQELKIKTNDDIFVSEDDSASVPQQSPQINKYITHSPLKYGKKLYITEFLAERTIQSIAFLSIAAILAIFYFVFHEAIFAFSQPERAQSTPEMQQEVSATDSSSTGTSIDAATNSGELEPESYGEDLAPETYGDDLTPETYGEEPHAKAASPKVATKENKSEIKPTKKAKPADDDLAPESYGDDLAPETYGDEGIEPIPALAAEQAPDADAAGSATEGTAVQESAPEAPQEAVNSENHGEKTVTIRDLLAPNDTIEGKAEYVWQPIGERPKFSFIPLFLGALKVTMIGIVIAAPIAILAAIFTTAFAPRWMREIMKPAIEILAGFPSIVIGFFCLITLASVVQGIFGNDFRLNSFVGGLGMSLAVIPIIFTVTEDALSAVPKYMKEASLALGASRWQTAYRVILPAATPGVFAAIILGFGRAFGETMIALMATGNAALTTVNIFDSVRTMAATIGAEMAEVPHQSVHYGVLFLIGSSLFVVTFALNATAEFYIRKKLMKKFQGK